MKSLIVTLVLLLSFIACGDNEEEDYNTESDISILDRNEIIELAPTAYFSSSSCFKNGSVDNIDCTVDGCSLTAFMNDKFALVLISLGEVVQSYSDDCQPFSHPKKLYTVSRLEFLSGNISADFKQVLVDARFLSEADSNKLYIASIKEYRGDYHLLQNLEVVGDNLEDAVSYEDIVLPRTINGIIHEVESALSDEQCQRIASDLPFEGLHYNNLECLGD